MNDSSPIQGFALRKSFGSRKRGNHVEVLPGLNISVRAGLLTALVGPSGCGKTTLLQGLAGLDRFDSGQLLIFDKEATDMSRTALAKQYQKRIGFVFQSANLIDSLSVMQNVVISDSLLRRKPDLPRARQLLEQFTVGSKADSLPLELSVGQRQRVAVARVLYQQPEIIFADEPTGALDTVSGRLVMAALREYPQTGPAGSTRTVLLVTHDLGAAAQADQVLVMGDGVIKAELSRPTQAQIQSIIEAHLTEMTQ